MEEDDINRRLTWYHLDEDNKVMQQWYGEKPFKDINLDDEEKTPDLIKQFYQ
jgi:hypothetical protein